MRSRPPNGSYAATASRAGSCQPASGRRCGALPGPRRPRGDRALLERDASTASRGGSRAGSPTIRSRSRSSGSDARFTAVASLFNKVSGRSASRSLDRAPAVHARQRLRTTRSTSRAKTRCRCSGAGHRAWQRFVRRAGCARVTESPPDRGLSGVVARDRPRARHAKDALGDGLPDLAWFYARRARRHVDSVEARCSRGAESTRAPAPARTLARVRSRRRPAEL
jgi:hypothetical protein